MSRIIVHIDLNAFFVRAEEIKDPTLEGKAVAIGHEGRGGIVSTCSYEARKYGVSSGMPMFKAKELCRHLIIKEVDFRFYRTLSKLFRKFVSGYTNIIEVASVDEVYADFTDVLKDVKDIKSYFLDFQKNLYLETKLKCSIGVANTKFLAKMGSDYKKPNGLTIIYKEDIPSLLYPLPIKDMFGIGKKTAPRLISIGINTIGDLANALNNNHKETYDILGKFAYVLKEWISGEGNDVIETIPDDPKSIGNSSTFSHDTSQFEEIKEMFSYLSKEVSDRAKQAGKVGTTIQIVCKDTNFQVRNKSISFPTPTNEYLDIYHTAIRLYEKYFLNLNVRLVGVTLQNLVSVKDVIITTTLFNYEEVEEKFKTKILINEINRKLKKPMLKRASEVEKKDEDK